MRSVRAWLLLGWLLAVAGFPSIAAAHDDPIVTVRVMCDGFNTLDMDAVLGELADTPTLKIAGDARGTTQIQDWVQQQMDEDLRIEILNFGTPQKLSDGYTLTWTGRFSRQDWRKLGISTQVVSNIVVIRNGRIAEWTAEVIDAGAPTPPPLAAAVLPAPSDPADTMPEMFGIPVSLLLAAAVAITGAAALVVVSKRGA